MKDFIDNTDDVFTRDHKLEKELTGKYICDKVQFFQFGNPILQIKKIHAKIPKSRNDLKDKGLTDDIVKRIQNGEIILLDIWYTRVEDNDNKIRLMHCGYNEYFKNNYFVESDLDSIKLLRELAIMNGYADSE